MSNEVSNRVFARVNKITDVSELMPILVEYEPLEDGEAFYRALQRLSKLKMKAAERKAMAEYIEGYLTKRGSEFRYWSVINSYLLETVQKSAKLAPEYFERCLQRADKEYGLEVLLKTCLKSGDAAKMAERFSAFAQRVAPEAALSKTSKMRLVLLDYYLSNEVDAPHPHLFCPFASAARPALEALNAFPLVPFKVKEKTTFANSLTGAKSDLPVSYECRYSMAVWAKLPEQFSVPFHDDEKQVLRRHRGDCMWAKPGTKPATGFFDIGWLETSQEHVVCRANDGTIWRIDHENVGVASGGRSLTQMLAQVS